MADNLHGELATAQGRAGNRARRKITRARRAQQGQREERGATGIKAGRSFHGRAGNRTHDGARRDAGSKELIGVAKLGHREEHAAEREAER
jgi:hypothetical protein